MLRTDLNREYPNRFLKNIKLKSKGFAGKNKKVKSNQTQ